MIIVTKPCEGTCGGLITGAPHKRFCRPCRSARYKVTTRYLSPGEQVPPGAPGRYPSSHGYIRLRWTVGPYEKVETYEHRVIDGRVTVDEQVHHVNHDRADNTPANLRPLTALQHHREHADVAWRAHAAYMYKAGASTYKIGKEFGRNPSTVYRALVKMGVPLRSEERIAVPLRELNRH